MTTSSPGLRQAVSERRLEDVAMRHDDGMLPTAFDHLMAAGRTAVLSGDHAIEGAPAETGRWGPSVVFLPNGPVAAALGRLILEVVEILSERHWPSRGLGRAHITVRALEPYIESIPQDRAARYVAAMTRALRDIGSACLEVVGVGLSPSGVMACAVSVDGAADRLRHRLNEELGDDGWLERTVFEHGRDPIWYCTLVHFAEPILDPGKLVTWADQRISWGFGPAIFDSVALCTWSSMERR